MADSRLICSIELNADVREATKPNDDANRRDAETPQPQVHGFPIRTKVSCKIIGSD